MIYCLLQGGFGNHMLNTFLGIILHHYTKKPITLCSNEITNDTNFQRNDTRTAIYKIVNPSVFNGDTTCYDTITINSSSEYYNIYNAIKENPDNYKNTNIYINIILVDDMGFYCNNIDIIRQYVTIEHPQVDLSDSIVLSLRLGMGEAEVCNPSPFSNILKLPLQYYKDAINILDKKYSKIYICSDNYSDDYINEIITNYDNVILLNNYNTYDQFCILVNTPVMISSNSSFSIVASLFNKNSVLFPRFANTGSIYPTGFSYDYTAKQYNNILPNVISVDIK
jgi:hypothetical protein